MNAYRDDRDGARAHPSQRRWNQLRRGQRTFAVSMVGYFVFLLLAIAVVGGSAPFARELAFILIVTGVVLVLGGATAMCADQDEFEFSITLRALAIAFAGGSATTFSYGCAQVFLGAPDITYMFVWPVYATAWAIAAVALNLRLGLWSRWNN
ncbi:hypothetical protein M0E87_10485 [Corynebacterium sp. CCM 9185]|uniref:Uncharacterized protein n=1 Tax=Corynebacterium marambiense TaxID=2765364 RepID=A0ABS0VX82_9CORY|nr:hypothetical protein [Corynebacterium marambiense]MBI9001396.1 hypothetical protein [Corynebacterium marambiense]MCK7664078.1 hypothetical protein [Corynebacterium marambiense]MCX7543415.1 hypothetical protein [Corynebacterium marambiense]